MPRHLISIALVVAALGGRAHAEGFAGVYGGVSSDGQNVLELTQTGTKVSGTYTVGPTRLTITGVASGGKVEATATLDGAPVTFSVVLRVEGDHLVGEITERDENGHPDPHTTEKIVFKRQGGAAADKPKPSPAPAKQTATPTPTAIDRSELGTIAARVKKNFKPESSAKVLAQGTPPLTRESVAAFGELLRLTFGVELSESEYDDTVAVFVSYYQAGDAQTRTMLATGWQSVLAELRKASGAAQKKAIDEVRAVLAQRFEAGAQAGIPWAITMNATIQKRTTTVATTKGAVPDYAKKAQLHTQMSEADLDASLEMLYFMWVASGRDASLVTPEAAAQVRGLIVQNFATFPPQVQLMFANGQKVYSALRGQWAQATPAQRVQLAQQFAASLDQLGLRVPTAGGDRISASGAWSDVNGKSHGEWAGEMVQGLAGSSYHSSW